MAIISDLVDKAIPVIKNPNNAYHTSLYKTDPKITLDQNVSFSNDGLTSAELDRKTEGWRQYLKGKSAEDIDQALKAREEAVKSGRDVEPEVSIVDKVKKYGENMSDTFKDIIDKTKEHSGTIIPAAALGLAGVGLYKYLKNKKKKQEEV